MRKVLMFNMVTLDGFFEGPHGEIDWHRVDAEFNEFAAEQLDSVDALLFGRKTYAMMAGYWPTPLAIRDDPVIAEKMNTKSKLVFSRTLKKAAWSNTRLVGENAAEELLKLKAQPGRDLIILGSANLSAALTEDGLIDEYRLIVNPVILGTGRLLFEDVHEKLGLKLLGTRAFGNGNVLIRYQPDEKKAGGNGSR
jgi:dihydrofolate reductase